MNPTPVPDSDMKKPLPPRGIDPWPTSTKELTLLQNSRLQQACNNMESPDIGLL
jgi:hypothetical protein